MKNENEGVTKGNGRRRERGEGRKTEENQKSHPSFFKGTNFFFRKWFFWGRVKIFFLKKKKRYP
jgi:hypothetical protein